MLAVAVDDGQIQRLSVDVELVASELDDAGATFEEFVAVLELADGLLAEAFQAGGEVVGFDGVPEGEELIDGLADLGDHHVRGEVGVDFLDGLEGGEAVADDLEHALGGGEEGGGAFVAGFDERDLALFEGLVEFGAAVLR